MRSKFALKPFFPYYGSKWRIITSYPTPRFARVVEPFAGSASYACHYPFHSVELYDLDGAVCSVWDYLIRVTEEEIARIPNVREFVDEDLRDWPQETRNLVGFWCAKGETRPVKRACSWMRSRRYPKQFWGSDVRSRLMRQVQFIRHWRIQQSSAFTKAFDESATWFVDPPYSVAPGKRYKEKLINYDHLRVWCQSLCGQVIVCGQVGEQWAPFTPHVMAKANYATQWSHEAIWLPNQPKIASPPATS